MAAFYVEAVRNMDDVSGHSCLLAFDTDEPMFARGFEAGRLWALLRADDGELVECIHANNAEMALRMGEATGRHVAARELGGEWLEATFSPVECPEA